MSNGSISRTVRHYSNKEVPFRFHGEDLSFFLSQGLFSSYSIDKGSELLLKLIAQKGLAAGASSCLDAGCGVGVLGISLKKKYPGMELLLQDRDALAVHFSEENGKHNRLSPGFAVAGGLALEGLAGRRFDLIVSNWPAKAGEPVLRSFFHTAPLFSSALAMVIVSPLKEEARAFASEAGWSIIHREETRNYFAFSAEHPGPGETGQAGQAGQAPETLEPYNRGRFSCEDYQLETVYGLPGFDTLPYQLKLLREEAESILTSLGSLEGGTLIHNPGQGHIPAILLTAAKRHDLFLPSPVELESRDRLQLLNSARYLQERGRSDIRLLHDPSPLDDPKQAESTALAVMDVDHVPGTSLDQDCWEWAGKRICPGGKLVFTGPSSKLSALSTGAPGFALRGSRKYHGYRILIFTRQA